MFNPAPNLPHTRRGNFRRGGQGILFRGRDAGVRYGRNARTDRTDGPHRWKCTNGSAVMELQELERIGGVA